MILAVFDTNVLVSAALGRDGPPSRLIRAWREDQFLLISSPALLTEFQRVLARPVIATASTLTDDERQNLVAYLTEAATIVVPSETISFVERDPPDNRVLEAATTAGADYIVTGDQDLLTIGQYRGIQIVRPAIFLAIIHAARGGA